MIDQELMNKWKKSRILEKVFESDEKIEGIPESFGYVNGKRVIFWNNDEEEII